MRPVFDDNLNAPFSALERAEGGEAFGFGYWVVKVLGSLSVLSSEPKGVKLKSTVLLEPGTSGFQCSRASRRG